ncbi:MAG: hypothetical protein PUA47_00510 [Bacteroidales bacterium]|nr:hypothetical protein [Bacteroidales bacterium]
MFRNIIPLLSAAAAAIVLASSCSDRKLPGNGNWIFEGASGQVSIPRIDSMPDIPSTYMMIDWAAKARAYDAYVFDWNRVVKPKDLIWLDTSRKNVDFDVFGLRTTVDDCRQGPGINTSSHEAINTMAAVLSGGLMGIDKTAQDGHNYARMLQGYYSKDWGIMLNGTSGYATDWWYNVLPNLLYYGVCDIFPKVAGAEAIQRSIADRFASADEILGKNYSHSYFHYGWMAPVDGSIPFQEDAAGGHAYVLLNAYRKFGDVKYLDRAVNAIDVLDSQKESRFYEILLPFGIYCAAYLNAAEGKDYDIARMMKWVFNGCTSSSGRNGWGVITGKWGDYDVSGLQGSITDGGGYAFLMNSFEMAWPLVPMVKYQPQWARAIGRWMLNNASASRLFYPGYIDRTHQYARDHIGYTDNNIAYEGLRKTDRYNVYGVSPIAEGDGPSWISGNGTTTMFSLYSTSPVGIFGSIISLTDVEGVIRLDCNATDFYAERKYPVYLYYNPYDHEVRIKLEDVRYRRYDLFDITTRTYLDKGYEGTAEIILQPHSARVLYVLPGGTCLEQNEDGRIVDQDGFTVAY